MLEIREDGNTKSKNAIAPEIQEGKDGREEVPMQIYGKKYPKYWWTSHLVQYPTVYCAVFSFIPLILTILSIGVNPAVDRDAGAFSIRDHPTARRLKTADDLQTVWRSLYDASLITNAAFNTRFISRAQPKYRLYVNYQANVEEILANYPLNDTRTQDLMNLLKPEAMSYMHTFESGLSRMESYRALCWNSPFRGGNYDSVAITYPTCTPLTSLQTYFHIGYRHNASGVTYWDFDGVSGDPQVPEEKVLDRIWVNPRHRWFMDQDATNENRDTQYLRTQITLGWPVFKPGTAEPMDEQEYNSKVDTFVLELLDYFRNSFKSDFITITYGGDRIQEALILQALSRDGLYIGLSLLIVFFVLWYHFHSVILSMIATLQILLTYPAAFFIYVGFSGAKEVSLLTALTFYVTLVMTLDGMMIIFDTFKHSGFMATTGRTNTLSIEQRVAYVYRKSGVGVGVSCFIALICFAVNTSSPVPAISGFAGLMVVLVCLNAYMLLLVFPSAMLFHHFHISKRRRNLQRQKEILVDRQVRHRYTPQQIFHHEVEELMAQHEQATYQQTLEYMASEAKVEQQERDKRAGILGFLGVQNPIRVPNPFRNHQAVKPEFSPTDDGTAGESSAEAQDFVDQFPDAVPDGRGGVIIKGESSNAAPPSKRCLAVNELMHINNYNIDEMLGFDDTVLRHKLHETGHSAADEFNRDELRGMVKEFGISSLGTKADERLTTVARTAIYLIFGVARTLNGACYEDNNDQGGGKRRKKKRGGPGGVAAAAAAGTAAAAAAGTAQPADSGEAEQPDRPAEQQQQPQPPQKKKHRFKVTKKISDWWEDRKSTDRKWCCGMLGQRVNETPAERQARIMKKKVKHEGFSPMERFFFNKWAPMLKFLRFPILALLLFFLIGASIVSGFLEPSTTPPEFLGDNPSEAYDKVAPLFGEEGPCDYCSAYFRPINDFPNPSREAIQQCSFLYSAQLMHAEIDKCGVCFGTDDCLDCGGTPYGNAELDQCGQCLNTTDNRWNSCTRCEQKPNDMACSVCYTNRGASLYYGGASCNQYCDPTINCLPEHGKCNSDTGKCECHHDWTLGFWEDDPAFAPGNGRRWSETKFCSRCLTGESGESAFSGGSCLTECTSPGDVPDPCVCSLMPDTHDETPNNYRCTGCPAGYFGSSCRAKRRDVCNNGAVSATTGVCVCEDGWAGDSCSTSSLCNENGVYLDPSVLAPGELGRCRCNNNWRGPNCTYCACYNGGTCDSEGKCVCTGAWTGDDCSTCNSECSANVGGECPFPLPQNLYTVSNCRALFCTREELRTRTATTDSCLACAPTATTCDTLSSTLCTTAPCGIDPFTGSCAYMYPPTSVIPDENTNCRCKGVFTGSNCETCPSPSAGVNCTDEGVLVGCDGLPSASGNYKVVDNCGYCGGSQRCLGCDGVPGSFKQVDDCGVCGGANECQGSVEPTADITIVYGATPKGDIVPDGLFNLTDPRVQNYLEFICTQLWTSQANVINPDQSKCVWNDFMAWAVTPEAQAELGYTVLFPFQDSRVHQAFYFFARSNGRLTEAGFSSTDTNSEGFRTNWIQIHLRSTNVPKYGTVNQLQRGYDYWDDRVLARLIEFAVNVDIYPPFMASPTWVSLFTQQAAIKGTAFSVVFGVIIFIAVVLPITCSPVLTTIGAITLVSCVLCVTALFQFAGWSIGPVEQLVMSLLMGGCSGQVVHMLEGYLEYIHSAQSHMFAKETSRLQAIKGMFQRTGVTVFISACTLVGSSLLLFFCDLVVFRRVGQIVIMICCTVMFHCLCLVGGVLCIFAPTVSYRKPKVMGIFAICSFLIACIILMGIGFSGALSVSVEDD